MTLKRGRCIIFQWVVSDNESHVGMLIEQLRYADILRIVRETHADNKTTYMLELKAPRLVKGIGSIEAWASVNARRMQSFGINAQDTWTDDVEESAG